MAEALGSDVSVHLATRQDLLLLRKDVDVLRKDMEHLGDRLMLRLGGFIAVSLGVLFAALRYVP